MGFLAVEWERSVPAAYLPYGTAIGARFDRGLAIEIGYMLATEVKGSPLR
jgi:beta-glucosidase-like glycosyl hydrolase